MGVDNKVYVSLLLKFSFILLPIFAVQVLLKMQKKDIRLPDEVSELCY